MHIYAVFSLSTHLHGAPRLAPVWSVDHSLEGSLGDHLDGHGAAGARRLHHRLEAVARQTLLPTHLKKRKNECLNWAYVEIFFDSPICNVHTQDLRPHVMLRFTSIYIKRSLRVHFDGETHPLFPIKKNIPTG